MSTDLVVKQQQHSKPLTISEVKSQVNLIQQVLAGVMSKDTHYGTIPGTNKPTLYKAGAEKILTTFRIAIRPTVEDLSNADERRYRVIAEGVLPSGEVIGSGVGECSTDEEKYRWRSAVCADEFEATPEDRRRIKYSKSGANINQVRTNPADLANTVLKMAKKRALIDLCLTCTACSDIFEQDLDDMDEETRKHIMGNRPKSGKPEVSPPQSRGTNQKTGTGDFITEGQQKMVYAKLKTAGLEAYQLTEHLAIADLSEITKKELTDVVRLVESGELTGKENLGW